MGRFGLTMKKVILLLLFIVSMSIAQNVTIAVLDFENNGGLKPSEVKILSARLQSEMVKAGGYKVVERKKIEKIFEEQKFQMSGCVAECLIEIGMLLGAKQIVIGDVGKFGTTYTINARLVDATTGEILRASDFDTDGDISGLLEGTRNIAIELSGLGKQSSLNNRTKTSSILESLNKKVHTNTKSPKQKKPSNPAVTDSKKIESVIPVKRLPNGWVFRGELLAPWSTSLPAVLTIVPDTTVEVVYTDESRTTKDGIVLPIKRATVEFNYVTRLTIERITLGFVNIDYVYSTTNNSDSHYILESVVKKIKLKDTGFPQLTAEDVIKHKVLMEYGTPREYDGVWHNYGDENSIFRVRKLDERNVKVEVDGLQIADKLNKAIEDVYSQQGIEYKKRLMMDGIDL